jgi:hypothetical protein
VVINLTTAKALGLDVCRIGCSRGSGLSADKATEFISAAAQFFNASG